MRRRGGWLGQVHGLGAAFLEVVRAELAALSSDLAASGRSLARVLVLFAGAFAVAFWTFALVVYFLIELLALKLPRWGAVGAVLALFLLVTLLLIWRGMTRMRRLEPPAAAVRRRWHAHAEWWNERVVGEPSERVFPLDDEELDE